MNLKEKLQNGELLKVDIPRGETRYTTNGVSFKDALDNFQKEMPDGLNASDYVRNNDGKLECKVDWGNGPEWVSGDVITQVRGQENPLYMFTPIDRSVIDSPDWANVKNGEKGEMFKPEQNGVKAIEFNGKNQDTILKEFGIEKASEHSGTYVKKDSWDKLEVCSLEKPDGQPLKEGQVLLEGGANKELYANTEKVFLKKGPDFAQENDNLVEKEMDNLDKDTSTNDYEDDYSDDDFEN